MSMMNRYSREEIEGMSKQEFMSKADYHAVLHESPCGFEVACLIREPTNHVGQKKAFEIQKDMILGLIQGTPHFHMIEGNVFEEVVSGLKAEKRETFKLMRKRAGEHKFDILVVDAVGRLTRNVKDLMIVIDDLKELGIGILIVKSEYWTYNMDYTGIMMLSVEGGLAQAESMGQEPTEAYIVKLIFEKFCPDDPNETLTSSSLCQYLIENRYFTYKGDLK